MKTLKSFVCLIAVLSSSLLSAGFSNSGTFQSNHLNLNVGGNLNNDGKLIGRESATLNCDSLTGSGLISSPKITINAKMFGFTGTIECTGTCIITTSAPIDQEMFKKTGGGDFTFLVDESWTLNNKKYSLSKNFYITDDSDLDEDM